MKCIACNQEVTDAKALSIHKQNYCSKWKDYLSRISQDPDVRNSIIKNGFSPTCKLIQVSPSVLMKIFPDLHTLHPYTPRNAKQQQRLEDVAKVVAWKVRDPTREEVTQGIVDMSVDYARLKNESTQYQSTLQHKDEQIEQLNRQLVELGETVIQLKSQLKEIMDKNTQSIAMNLRARDTLQSMMSQQALGNKS